MTPPPGYVAYGNAPTLSALRRVGGLSVAVIILTAIVAISTVVSTILTASASQDAEAFLLGGMSEDDFNEAIRPYTAVQLIVGLATLATFVVTAIWMYRLATNVRAFRRDTTWSPLFAVFGWMLPPIVFVIPFLMLRELWKASDATDPDDPESWRSSPDTPLVWAWFLLYGIVPFVLFLFSIGSLVGSGLSASGSAESLAESLDDFGAVQFLTSAVSVAAAVAWILLVKGLTARHKQLTSEH